MTKHTDPSRCSSKHSGPADGRSAPPFSHASLGRRCGATDAKLRHLLLEALAVQAELSGGGGDVADIIRQSGFDRGPLEFLDQPSFGFGERKVTKMVERRRIG